MVQSHRCPVKYVVLVVEDDPIVRLLAVDIINDAGFDAIEAGDADEAVLILESRTDIRIVFTDVEMPGSMDGIKLAQAIRGRWPPIELILTSGHCRIRPEDIPAGGRFFGKPYHPDDLTQALHQLAA
jgi:two-component system, response regulator PdtaR